MIKIKPVETSILMSLLSERIKILRKDKKLSQTRLAALAHVSQSSVSNLESGGGLGRISVTLETANEVARILGVELWQLILPPNIPISSSEIVALLHNFLQSNPAGRSDILKIADLAAKYQK